MPKFNTKSNRYHGKSGQFAVKPKKSKRKKTK
jgi:hypothetical protein